LGVPPASVFHREAEITLQSHIVRVVDNAGIEICRAAGLGPDTPIGRDCSIGGSSSNGHVVSHMPCWFRVRTGDRAAGKMAQLPSRWSGMAPPNGAGRSCIKGRAGGLGRPNNPPARFNIGRCFRKIVSFPPRSHGRGFFAPLPGTQGAVARPALLFVPKRRHHRVVTGRRDIAPLASRPKFPSP
jgi:hypothetical protein